LEGKAKDDEEEKELKEKDKMLKGKLEEKIWQKSG
jgi:hypothetical protein